MITAILLAAGSSTRFGSPKALAKIESEPIIARLQRVLIDSNVDRIIVVLGAAAETIEPHLLKHIKVRVVHNKDYKLGQTSSFQTGMRGLDPSGQGVLLVPVDFPGIRTETVNILLQDFVQKDPAVLIPTYLGQKGHPPVFSARLYNELLELRSDEGIHVLAQRHRADVILSPVDDPGVVGTFNTVQEFEKIMRQWGG